MQLFDEELISFDPNILSAADGRAQIFQTDAMFRQTSLEGEHSLGLNDCCWVDERLLATASDDNTIVLWDVEVVKIGKTATVVTSSLPKINSLI